MQQISKTRLVDNKVVSDAEMLFSGERTGHVGYLAYGSSDALNDNVFGADMWTKLRLTESYYLAREDDDLLKSVIARIPSLNLNVKSFVDLGPGDRNALNSKTFPLIQALKADKYAAIDMAEDYALEAANYVAHKFRIDSQAYVANFLENELPFKKKKTLLFMGGSTLSNIPVDIRTKDPTLYLSSQLSKLRNSVDDKSFMLIGFDANQDAKGVKKCYSSKFLARLIEDTMWRIARDTDFNFDPEAFKYHGEWHASEHRYAHSVMATKDCSVTMNNKTAYFKKGNLLHLQNSYKFPVELLQKAAANAGWASKMVWTETDRAHYVLFQAI